MRTPSASSGSATRPALRRAAEGLPGRPARRAESGRRPSRELLASEQTAADGAELRTRADPCAARAAMPMIAAALLSEARHHRTHLRRSGAIDQRTERGRGLRGAHRGGRRSTDLAAVALVAGAAGMVRLALHPADRPRRRAGAQPGAGRLPELLGNVTFLERPFHPTTLVSVARSAIRCRRRQYEARASLDQYILLARELQHRTKNLLSVVHR